MESKHSHWPSYPFFVVRTGNDKYHVENLQSFSDTRYPDRDTYAQADNDAVALKKAYQAAYEKTGVAPEHVDLATALHSTDVPSEPVALPA